MRKVALFHFAIAGLPEEHVEDVEERDLQARRRGVSHAPCYRQREGCRPPREVPGKKERKKERKKEKESADRTDGV